MDGIGEIVAAELNRRQIDRDDSGNPTGGGVAAGSLGVPDLGISGLDDVLTDVRRITDACTLPLLVDVYTGFGASAFNVAPSFGLGDRA